MLPKGGSVWCCRSGIWSTGRSSNPGREREVQHLNYVEAGGCDGVVLGIVEKLPKLIHISIQHLKMFILSIYHLI